MTETETTLRDDIEAVCLKHGATQAAFCCTVEDRFFGGIIGKQTVTDFFASVCNVGRLWQYAREMMRNNLNKYEGQP